MQHFLCIEGTSIMASIMTNASAMTALQTLNATNKNLETTQSRISTGYRVAEATDNAAYWSIATTMRSDNKALSTVQDALGLGAAKVDTAYTGMNKAIEVVNEIKAKLVAANGASAADKAKIQVEITALQEQLKSYADAATFSGANWLSDRHDRCGRAAGTDDRPDGRQDRLGLQPHRRRLRLARHHRRQGRRTSSCSTHGTTTAGQERRHPRPPDPSSAASRRHARRSARAGVRPTRRDRAAIRRRHATPSAIDSSVDKLDMTTPADHRQHDHRLYQGRRRAEGR